VSEPSRRQFLAAAAGAATLLALSGCQGSSSSTKKKQTVTTKGAALPDPKGAPFDHVVLLMMENRSFDHLLGWLPGTDGRQVGLAYTDTEGNPQHTFDLGSDYQGCKYAIPGHTWQAGVTHLDGGKADGFLKTAKPGDPYPIGYYTKKAIPVTAALAGGYTTFDNYFAALNAGTWPNRFYMHAAATDVDETGIFPGGPPGTPAGMSNIQTAIWDRLAAAGLAGRYYSVTEPVTGQFTSRRYGSISKPYQEFLADAKAGSLPNVAYVDPDFGAIAELTGTSNDDHTFGSIQVGEGLIQEVYDAVRNSPQWDRTVFVLNFDEWGGFYDHVAPPKVVDDNVNPAPGPHPDYSQLGFRVPCIVMSPFAPSQIVTGGAPFEHCSILRMIEWRWGLQPMTARDKNARNLAEALDFSKRRPALDLPKFTAPAPAPCAPRSAG
jgi:phospholipase C